MSYEPPKNVTLESLNDISSLEESSDIQEEDSVSSSSDSSNDFNQTDVCKNEFRKSDDDSDSNGEGMIIK